MNSSDIVYQRLHNQGLLSTKFKTFADVVRHLGAVQSQDFPGALWAIAQRLPATTEAHLIEVFNRGDIIRTHALRPTWHFVAPEDVRWILQLNAPRVKPILHYYDKKLGLDDALFKRTQDIMAHALEKKNFLTRSELVNILIRKDIKTNGQGFGHIMAYAELDGVICSGPKKGSQYTYALLEERVPPTKRKTDNEALTELALRYFTSHGPAQIKDFSWWSGYTAVQIHKAMDAIKGKLDSVTVADKTFWFSSHMKLAKNQPNCVFLLPNYDEFTIAYKDRSDFLDNSVSMDKRNNIIFNNSIISNGKMIGAWRREIKKDTVTVKVKLTRKITSIEEEGIQDRINSYGRFLSLKPALEYLPSDL